MDSSSSPIRRTPIHFDGNAASVAAVLFVGLSRIAPGREL